MKKKKVIVIGAGPGGLTGAMILAKRGFDVTVFEKNPVVGGRNAPLRVKEFLFDTGPTFLMMKFILDEMFEETGRAAADYLTFTQLDPMYRLRFNGFEINPTNNKDSMKKQIAALLPGAESGYDRFLEKEKTRFERLFPCLQKPYSTPAAFLNPIFLKSIPHLTVFKSMFDKLGDYFDDEKLRLSFTFQSKYLGMSAWECPAAFNIIPYIEHAFGIYHVTGGLNAISLAMEKVVQEEGGIIHKDCAVKNLIMDGKTVKGVLLENGEKYFADEFIINADFGYSMTHIVEKNSLRKYTPRKLDGFRLSCSIFMLYLGVEKCYDIPHHNIFFANNYRRNVEDIFVTLKLSEDSSFYIQNASITDSTLAPAGKSALYVLVPVPNNKSRIDWDKEKGWFRDNIIRLIEQRTELSDLSRHIEAEKIITPATWEGEYNVFKGATFNLGHNISQMLYFRPRNKFEEFDNCYLAGGGTHPGSGLPTIYESARISSNLICEKYGVPFNPPTSLSEKKTLA